MCLRLKNGGSDLTRKVARQEILIDRNHMILQVSHGALYMPGLTDNYLGGGSETVVNWLRKGVALDPVD